jgi:hypothetical protein
MPCKLLCCAGWLAQGAQCINVWHIMPSITLLSRASEIVRMHMPAGANIAGFLKVADAVMAEGAV